MVCNYDKFGVFEAVILRDNCPTPVIVYIFIYTNANCIYKNYYVTSADKLYFFTFKFRNVGTLKSVYKMKLKENETVYCIRTIVNTAIILCNENQGNKFVDLAIKSLAFIAGP